MQQKIWFCFCDRILLFQQHSFFDCATFDQVLLLIYFYFIFTFVYVLTFNEKKFFCILYFSMVAFHITQYNDKICANSFTALWSTCEKKIKNWKLRIREKKKGLLPDLIFNEEYSLSPRDMLHLSRFVSTGFFRAATRATNVSFRSH